MSSAINKVLGAKTPAKERVDFRDGFGVAILKDIKVIKGQTDGVTKYIIETVIKTSSPDPEYPGVSPNPPGQEVSAVEVFSLKGADSRARGWLVAILGPAIDKAATEEELAKVSKEVEELLRLGPDDQTIRGSTCPARGIEVDYRTHRKDFRDGPGTVVRFYHRQFNPDAVKANLAILDGKALPK